MNIQIKNRFTGAIIHEGDYVNILEALSTAIKSRANLYGADLSHADLSHANLYGANLSHANLYGANLSGADLSRANLSHADLYGANLSHANLYGANLYGANLSHANLSHADLSHANLYGANLSHADLYGAKNADLIIARTRILPEGDLIGYKKCQNNVIVKLKIPHNARRSHAFGRKCRAEFAEVLEIFGAETAISTHDNKTLFKVGETVYPDKWSENWQEECASGIHFFITKIEAENY